MFESITRPTLVINKSIAIANIIRMAGKAKQNKVRFRPHFKTHQSGVVGEWFREAGIHAITVSSVSMAEYFADNGWQDITVAFPANIREIDNINNLAGKIQLQLLVESVETVRFLENYLKHDVNAWLKIDTGYHRTGILWQDASQLLAVSNEIEKSRHLKLSGALTHPGHTYAADSTQQVESIYRETAARLQQVRETFSEAGLPKIEISIGDTPSNAIVADYGDIDEIRPGNFVFFDMMQVCIGACREADIACAIACPVVAKHPERGEIILYGGAVHLSKDAWNIGRQQCFGLVALPAANGWGTSLPDTYLKGMSQEHGIVRTTGEVMEKVNIGDLMMVLPVHSCLAADLLKDQVYIIE